MYEYKYTLENGWNKLNISRGAHRKICPNRKLSWFNSYHYLYNHDYVIIEHHASWLGVAAAFILFPVAVLFHGLENYKDIWKETVETIPSVAKKRGKFGVDQVSSKEQMYAELLWEHLK